jgi:hypothetical protein
MRSYLITTSGGSFDRINRRYLNWVTEKVSFGFSNGVTKMEIDDLGWLLRINNNTLAQRSGFFL